jgi:hypothetical protein
MKTLVGMNVTLGVKLAVTIIVHPRIKKLLSTNMSEEHIKLPTYIQDISVNSFEFFHIKDAKRNRGILLLWTKRPQSSR